MKLSANALRRFVQLPREPRALRDLLDDVGIEVKRLEPNGDDLALNVELLANRGDHYCYAGVAREISGRTGDPLCLPERATLTVGASPIPLRCETELCLVYTATLLEVDGPGGELHASVLAPIVGAGLAPVSAPVDATNLSNLELGQPTHAFDADRIEGGITVRTSRKGERAWPLFTEGHVELPEGTLVIADDVKILAVAGVIGCEDSKTTASTRRVLLESAAFDPVAVRLAARALDIATDASARFERGSDPSLPLGGAGRVVHLLEQCGWRVVGTTGAVGDWTDPARVITLDVSVASAFLATPITADDAAERLTRYGFAITDQQGDTLQVQVPPHRLWDVEWVADLYEELAKSIGYNEIPIRLPSIGVGAVPTAVQSRREAVEEVLLGHGFYEVFTDGFYGRQNRERLGLTEDHPLWDHVGTLNALDRGYSLLKNNALSQALEGVQHNQRMKTAEVRCYEWTRVFEPDSSADNGVCRERELLWLIASGHAHDPDWARRPRAADAWLLKGLVAEIAAALQLPQLMVAPADPTAPLSSLLHPGRQLAIALGGRRVGILGEVHPAVVSNHKLKRVRPVYLELDASVLAAAPTPPTYVEPDALHPVVRSLAFTLPGRIEAGSVRATLAAASPDWLEGVGIVDLFEHTLDDGSPARSVTFELTYAQSAAGRTTDEINGATEALIAAVHAAHGERGVTLRG